VSTGYNRPVKRADSRILEYAFLFNPDEIEPTERPFGRRARKNRIIREVPGKMEGQQKTTLECFF